MKYFLMMLALFVCEKSYASQVFIDTNYENPGNKRKFKTVILDNGLEVLLISDINLKKSAAALSIDLGSLDNPAESQGLVHYLEHMLFLGTKKFPGPKEYNDYISKNGGTKNAVTKDNLTVYYFDIEHGAFNGALDRFSQFFISPLFSKKFMNRELDAIQSEFIKDRDEDWRRFYRAQSNIYAEKSPKTYLPGGNKETLKNVNENVIKKFFSENYTAKRMKLILMSQNNFQEMEEIAKKYFKSINSANIKKNEPDKSKLKYLSSRLEIKSIQGNKLYQLIFPINLKIEDRLDKNGSFIHRLITYEQDNSFFDFLRKQNLVTDLDTYTEINSDGSYLTVSFYLSDKGFAKLDEIKNYFYQYIDQLKAMKSNDLKNFFQEIQSIDEIRYALREYTYPVGLQARIYAELAQVYQSTENIDKKSYLRLNFNEAKIRNILNAINFKAQTEIVFSPLVNTDKIEKYFGVKYKHEKSSSKTAAIIPAKFKNKKFSLPNKNPYVFKSIEFLPVASAKDKGFLNLEAGKISLNFNSSFGSPKVYMDLNIFYDEIDSTSLRYVYFKLLENVIKFRMDIKIRQFEKSGGSFRVIGMPNKLSIQVSGISASFMPFLSDLWKEINMIEIKNIKEFDMISKLVEEEFNGQSKAIASDLAKTNLHLVLNHVDQNILTTPIPMTYDNFVKYLNKFHKKYVVNGNLVGNYNYENISSIFYKYKSQTNELDRLNKTSLKPSTVSKFKNKYVTKHIGSNNVILFFVPIEKNNLSSLAMSKILMDLFGGDFFSVLRTEKQLGYTVKADLYQDDIFNGVSLLVQSEKFPPEKILLEIEKWIDSLEKKIDSMDLNFFNTRKRVLADSYKEEPSLLEEMFKNMLDNQQLFGANYNSKAILYQVELKKIRKKDLINFIKSFKDKKILIEVIRNVVQN